MFLSQVSKDFLRVFNGCSKVDKCKKKLRLGMLT